MKISNFLVVLAIVVFSVGCHTDNRTTTDTSFVPPRTSPASATQTASASKPAQIDSTATAPKISYRVEVIPNPRLSATSREGDKTNEVYSSNIIAVYVTSNGADAQTTNLNTSDIQGNAPDRGNAGTAR